MRAVRPDRISGPGTAYTGRTLRDPLRQAGPDNGIGMALKLCHLELRERTAEETAGPVRTHLQVGSSHSGRTSYTGALFDNLNEMRARVRGGNRVFKDCRSMSRAATFSDQHWTNRCGAKWKHSHYNICPGYHIGSSA